MHQLDRKLVFTRHSGYAGTSKHTKTWCTCKLIYKSVDLFDYRAEVIFLGCNEASVKPLVEPMKEMIKRI